MTERGASALKRSGEAMVVGPSALTFDGTALTIRIEEVTVPIPSRLRGVVRIEPAAMTPGPYALDEAGRHQWWPIAPAGRAIVRMERPQLAWQGKAYLDSNWGSEPLEDGFVSWDWSRAPHPDGGAVLYDMQRRQGGQKTLALLFDQQGGAAPFTPPRPAPLPTAPVWRIARAIHSEGEAKVVKTLEDTPFYARSLVKTRLAGAEVTAVHESLSLERFRSGWVKMLLPFRMPRAG